MATPMTPAQILAAYKAEGLTVREVDGWTRRCRCCPDTGPHRPAGPFIRGWGSVNGQVAHITAGNLGKRTVQQYIRDIINGDPKVPTKSQTVIDPDGVVWPNSAGRCNHAGKVGSKVRDHMIAANFSTTDDYDSRFRGSDDDGNSFTYGDECIAASKMNAKQYDSLVKVHAARARFHGWTGQESVGHGEISGARTKADPNLDMGKFRRDVMARVKAGTGKAPAPKPKPTPPVCAVPAPAPEPAPPITVMTWNLKSPTLLGKWLTWPLRRGGQVKIIEAAAPSVFLAQEVGPPSKERWYNGALSPKLTNVNAHNREGSGMWRAIWFDAKVFSRVTSGLYTLPSMLAKDDKQMAECILKDRNDEPYYFGSLHLENEDATGRTQVEQIEDCFNHAIKMRDQHGVRPERMFLGGDTNSRALVREWVETHTDYYDAAGRAKFAKNAGIKSINDWLPFRKGAREDLILVHKNVAVESFDQVDGHKVSDHNPQIIVTK